MAKQRRSRAIGAVTGRIARLVGSDPVPHDLPAAAWGRLLAAALSRLQRARPRWAAVTAAQIDTLLDSWLRFVQDPALSSTERELRIEEALEHLEAHPPWSLKGTGRTADWPHAQPARPRARRPVKRGRRRG